MLQTVGSQNRAREGRTWSPGACSSRQYAVHSCDASAACSTCIESEPSQSWVTGGISTHYARYAQPYQAFVKLGAAQKKGTCPRCAVMLSRSKRMCASCESGVR